MSAHRVLAAVAPLVLAAAACTQPAPPQASSTETAAAAPAQSAVERGRYLVTTSLCHDCHTPKQMGAAGPEPDMSRMLMGHPEDVQVTTPFVPPAGSPWLAAGNGDFTAWSGPWGISFAANLTPDTNTGLRSGVWTEELFMRAMRTGKHMGTARDILPPMPWPMIGQMSDDDLRAIWAYLGTIPAIRNQVPDPVPPAGQQ